MADQTRMVTLKLVVQLIEAKPNKMFTEEHRALVRFLRFNRSVACAECGRKGKVRWTMFCSFQAWSMAMIVPKKSGKVHLPLTPVCTSHLLAPEFDEERAGQVQGRDDQRSQPKAST